MVQARQIDYENSYKYNIISRIPVVIKLDGRLFSKVTKDTQKPFCQKTAALLNKTMLALVRQIDGTIFGYQYSDKIILILRNDRSKDESPWFGNDIQKIASISSSSATYEFMTNLWAIDNPPALDGSITFSAQVFATPSIKEACNYLIWRQWLCIHKAMNESLHSVLWPKYGQQTISMLEDKSIDDRRKILEDAGIDFASLPSIYRLGSAGYLIPTIANTAHGQVTRQKWWLDFDIPLFSDAQEWLKTILTTGSDIFRPERDYNEPNR